MFNITIDVLENGQINVSNGGTLTAKTFAILGEVFKLKEQHEVQPASSEQSWSYPRPATWSNKDHDQPVTVIGRLGDEKGINYYKIEESDTGIPENELDFNVEA